MKAVLLLACLAVALLKGYLAQGKDDFAPLVQIQSEDYAKVRSEFRTHLSRHGPTPQEWTPTTPPAGVTEINYESGTLHLPAWMNRPADPAKKYPAVLFLHGGFAFGLDDWEASQPYRDAGYIVMTPILRGENGQPGAYSFFYDEVDDVLAAGSFLRQQPFVDPTHLYIAGPSAGGTPALLAAMTSKMFRAVATFSASPDQVVFCKHARRAAQDVPFDVTNMRELEVRSPLAYAASFKCPARLYFGSKEPQWRQTSRRTAEVAKSHGLDVEAIEVPGDHGSSVLPGIRQSILFFQKQ